MAFKKRGEEMTWGEREGAREDHTVYGQQCIAIHQDNDNQTPMECDDERAKTLTQSRKERSCDGQETGEQEGDIAKDTWGQETR